MKLDRFPRRTLRGDRIIHRIHDADRSPWWFSADGSGRFDPVGTGMGACYLAERPLGAWVEVFRKTMLLPEAEVRHRSLLSVQLGRDVGLADLTSRRALGFGVTASLGADQDYEPSQTFAVRALEKGFAGVRYLIRHDPAQKLLGITLFGEAGAAESEAWPIGSEQPRSPELIAEAHRRFGYRVLPTP
ncbi:MAG: RES family NAD+ phosphorylase [Solirubrobacteraceae bacterium MAG38_C4-C5]|nr:RES family NAD+ phosphorylase [Candidatus Siliceabacter maunaloa]